MLFLLFSIFASGGMAITLRLAEQHGCNLKALTSANYVVAALASWALMQDKAVLPSAGMRLTLLLGAVNGCLFLATLLLYQINIEKNGTPLTVSFARLGVLVPTLLSLVIFKEYPRSLQWLGVALAAAAIVIINYDPAAGREKARHKLFHDVRSVYGLTGVRAGEVEAELELEQQRQEAVAGRALRHRRAGRHDVQGL